jgi:hypothetical protein
MSIIGKFINPNTVSRRRTRREEKPHTFQSIADVAVSFRPAPDLHWRLDREWVVLFLAGVLIFALVAALYLDVTARTAIIGRDIQKMEMQIDSNERANADLQTKIGSLMSNQNLQARAKSLGFESVGRADLIYVVVPGYYPHSAVNMVSAQPTHNWIEETPEFHNSMWVWLMDQMRAASTPLNQVEK